MIVASSRTQPMPPNSHVIAQVHRQIVDELLGPLPQLPAFPLGPFTREEQSRHADEQVEAIGAMERIAGTRFPTAISKKLRAEVEGHARTLLRVRLAVTPDVVDYALDSGLLRVAVSLHDTLLSVHPHLSEAAMLQAIHNMLAMGAMQLVLGTCPTMTPSAMAYSLLYPLTDNHIDDAARSSQEKRGFQERLARRLAGEAVAPENDGEREVFAMVPHIESEIPREECPDAFEGLCHIHRAQWRGLTLQKSGDGDEACIADVTADKGGWSVLAAGFLIARKLDVATIEQFYRFGATLQLMDDLDDAVEDARNDHLTLFSRAVRAGQPLDGLATRLFHMLDHTMRGFARIAAPRPEQELNMLTRLLHLNVMHVAFEGCARVAGQFSPAFLDVIQAHCPLPLDVLDTWSHSSSLVLRLKDSSSPLVRVLKTLSSLPDA